MLTNDTIVALSTPRGEGAIGVIRLSGEKSEEIVAKHIGNGITKAESHSATFSRFQIGDKVLDEVVATIFRNPRSYTGEDVVELSFHGSSYILSQALEALIESGARLAQPGEFTQRAFMNGKLDLSQAEAVADLIASESEAEHKLAMHQMRGGFSDEINRLREELINFASLIELELDFGEEDVEFANRDQLVSLVQKIQGFVQNLIESFRYGNAVKQGIPVAIIGKPNAGKSTLLNQLLNEDRAIVSDIAWTTRDTIEDIAIIEGLKFRFIDTAGLRDTDDDIEAQGVARSKQKMGSASIVLYLIDMSDVSETENSVDEMRSDLNGASLIVVANKSDLNAEKLPFVDLQISAKQGEGISELRSQLVRSIQAGNHAQGDVVVTNTRHLEALKATATALEAALSGINSGLSGDLVASDIREALHQLGSITGEVTPDDLLGNIFSRFCIGK